MPVIRLLNDQDGQAWFTLIGVGPIHRIPPVDEERYVVSERHLEVLRRKRIPYEEVAPPIKGTGQSSAAQERR
jgi:hypothetical protein